MFHSAHALCSSLLQQFTRLFRLAKWGRWVLAAGVCGGFVIAWAQSNGARVSISAELERVVQSIKRFNTGSKVSGPSRMTRKQAETTFGEFLYPDPPPKLMALLSGSPYLAASTTPAVNPSSFTPFAAFQGNQTAIVGRALETTPGKGDSVLVRANGCTLSQYSYPDLSASGSGSSFTFTGVEAHFRQLSGLAVVPASYPGGCTDRVLGTPSTTSGYLGQLANGDTLVAIADFAGKLTISRISTAACWSASKSSVQARAPLRWRTSTVMALPILFLRTGRRPTAARAWGCF